MFNIINGASSWNQWRQPLRCSCEFPPINRHLGYPLGVNVSAKDKIEWILRKIKCKMDKWYAPQWPLHARIRIVQAFLQPYIMYYLLLLDWRKSHIRIFDNLLENFLWSKKHNLAFILSAWEYVCQPKSSGGLGILHLHSHLMARRAAFIMRIIFSHRPLWTHIFWKSVARYLNNKGMDSIAKYYDSKWEFLSFPIIRRTYAVGSMYRSKWLEMVRFLQRYQMPLSIDASDPWRDWLLAKRTRWWTGKANIYYQSLIAPNSIVHQCNQRWKLEKSATWWQIRFRMIWDSSLTFKMKVFMWRIFVGHFTLGAFLSKHGLQGARCPHCSSYAENMRHAFWLCPCIQRWWNALFLLPIWDVKPTKFDCTFLLSVSANNASNWFKMRCVVFLLSNIWMLRNSKVFRNKFSMQTFSWQYCKTQLRLDIHAMLSEDKSSLLSLVNAI
ncbi:hypothetical protein KP509_09G099500 [Ceratopteris richardii]|uniref:Reverse transcriptase zinc-binding domain-containing protein n=1 Tax=Ceratopteris richardii TaxID=49495 RepID=A0A8T2U3V3_CERRI|nr:hypothetical protein KP509_09G099500 [Ceratopteris richardii]